MSKACAMPFDDMLCQTHGEESSGEVLMVIYIIKTHIYCCIYVFVFMHNSMSLYSTCLPTHDCS